MSRDSALSGVIIGLWCWLAQTSALVALHTNNVASIRIKAPCTSHNHKIFRHTALGISQQSEEQPTTTVAEDEDDIRNPTTRNSRTFSSDFQLEMEELLHWRRDVRRFQNETAVPEDILQRALHSAFASAPSVGLSEPWRIVRVESPQAKQAVLENFERSNAEALQGYLGEQKRTYGSLKLSGMKEAPVQLAIFCDETTAKGSGLGAKTMPEMRRYSVVSAITLFWLTTRSFGLGCGWVSILDPVELKRDLNLLEQQQKDWILVGYLCVGWPLEDHETPELERAGWDRRSKDLVVVSV